MNDLWFLFQDRLNDSIPELVERMHACNAEISPDQDPHEQLEDIKALTADVIAEGKLVEDLKQSGGELVAILDVLGCKETPKVG